MSLNLQVWWEGTLGTPENHLTGREDWLVDWGSFAFQGAPYVLPRQHAPGYSLYICSYEMLDANAIRDECRAFLGSSYSYFRDWMYPLAQGDLFEQALGSLGLIAIRLDISTSHIKEGVEQLRLWYATRAQQPKQNRALLRTSESFYREWKEAINRGDLLQVEQILEEIKEHRPFQGVNAKALQIITKAHFEQWSELLEIQGLQDCVHSILPRNAKESILKALFYIHLQPLLEQDSFADALRVFEEKIQYPFEALFRRQEHILCPEALLLFRLFRFVGQSVPHARDEWIRHRLPPKEEEPIWHRWFEGIQQELPADGEDVPTSSPEIPEEASVTGKEETETTATAVEEPIDSAPAKGIEEHRLFLEKGRKCFEEGAYIEAIQTLLHHPVSSDVARLLIESAHYADGQEPKVQVFDSLDTWMEENGEQLPQHIQKNWTKLVGSLERVRSWGELFQRATETYQPDKLLQLARTLADEWTSELAKRASHEDLQAAVELVDGFFSDDFNLKHIWPIMVEAICEAGSIEAWSPVVYKLFELGIYSSLRGERERDCLLQILLWLDQVSLDPSDASNIPELIADYAQDCDDLYSIRWLLGVLEQLRGRSLLPWEHLQSLIVQTGGLCLARPTLKNALTTWDLHVLLMLLPEEADPVLLAGVQELHQAKREKSAKMGMPSLIDLLGKLKQGISLGMYSLDETFLRKIKEEYLDVYASQVKWKPYSKTDASSVEETLLRGTDILFVVTSRAKHNVTYKIDNAVNKEEIFLRRCHEKGQTSLLRKMEQCLQEAWNSLKWKGRLFMPETP